MINMIRGYVRVNAHHVEVISGIKKNTRNVYLFGFTHMKISFLTQNI